MTHDNLYYFVSYLEKARSAVRGIVTDSEGNVVDNAVIRVSDRTKDVKTTPAGEYWRVLVPGVYFIKAVKDDMESEEVEVTVNDNDDYSRDSDVTIIIPINIIMTKTRTLTMTWKRLAFSRLRRRVVVICS